jgi:alpha-glucosidase
VVRTDGLEGRAIASVIVTNSPTAAAADMPWWKTATVYQIYPRSFCDTTGNGVGDLEGVIAHLDHLEWLGVDAIWLSPVFTSPMVDHGYDVADYCDIDPIFGDLEKFDRLVAEAHGRNIRVVLDWVPNHTSDRHDWFVESRSSLDSPLRDWYVWREGDPDTPPNNWQAALSPGPAWTWDESTASWYLHLFTPNQPDLDWSNHAVRDAMLDTLRFWLDRGVDGFRMDVVHLIAKPAGLPDRPGGPGQVIVDIDEPAVHDYLRDIRAVLDEYPQQPMSVGEVYLLDPHRVASYYGHDDELHLSFNFIALHGPWSAEHWNREIRAAQAAFDPVNAWPTWVLSNHDQTRHRQRYGGSERIARAAAVLLLTLRGTPFLYAGEELGLVDAEVPREQQQDPQGRRDGCRAPIPWDPTSTHGWQRSDNWLPFPPESTERNVATLRSDPNSILHLYRRLLELRRSSRPLQVGDMNVRDAPSGLVSWERSVDDDRVVVAVNMTNEPVSFALEGAWSTAIDSAVDADGDRRPYDGTVAPQSGVVLIPAT